MKLNRKFKQASIASAIIASAVIFTGCAKEDKTAELRVIHAAFDAPPVNVKLNDKVKIKDLDYAESSGFIDVNKGRKDIAVDAILPADELEVITVDRFRFEEGQRYTVVAIDDTANIGEFIAEESAASPAGDEVAISVLHAATSVRGIDVGVYITGPDADITGTEPNFSFDFTGQQDVGAVAAGEYRIRIVAGGDTANPAYDSGKVDLSGFAGQKLLILAVNTANSATQEASPVKLVAYTDSAQLELLDTDTTSAARVVHLSSTAGPVEVFASSSELPGSPVEIIDSFDYTEGAPADKKSYLFVPAADDYIFTVSGAGAGFGNPAFITPEALNLEKGKEYTAIAAGYVGMDPMFDILPTLDMNRSIVTQASVKVVHGAPLAGTVDVFVTPADQYTTAEILNGDAGKPTIDDFTFGTITDYVSLTPGEYDIRVVTDAGAGIAAIDIQDFPLGEGLVATVIANEPGGAVTDFGVVVLTN
jgi:hypothetical protein